MAGSKVAIRYAVSLFEVAEESNNLKSVFDDMNNIIIANRQDGDLSKTLQSPIVPIAKKEGLLRSVFANAQQETLNFFSLLTAKNRASELINVANEFIELYNSKNGILEVSVKSASELNETEKTKLVDFLEKQTGAKEIALNITVDPQLIGGMVIQYADRLLDNSIMSQIKNLKKELDIA